MADVKLTFVVPRNEVGAIFGMMEAEDTPKCELRIKKPNACVREIEIITDRENTGYFRETLGGHKQ